MIWIKLVKDVIKRMYCIFVKVQNIYTGLKGGSIMQNYIVSFLMFGIYLFIESVLKTKTINMNWFYRIVAIIALAGIIIINVFEFELFEYFFILTLIFSIIELYKRRKQNNKR